MLSGATSLQSGVVGAAAVASARPRILVVDDERFVRESIADLLELEGYSVRVAEDGLEELRASAGIGAASTAQSDSAGLTSCPSAGSLGACPSSGGVDGVRGRSRRMVLSPVMSRAPLVKTQ